MGVRVYVLFISPPITQQGPDPHPPPPSSSVHTRTHAPDPCPLLPGLQRRRLGGRGPAAAVGLEEGAEAVDDVVEERHLVGVLGAELEHAREDVPGWGTGEEESVLCRGRDEGKARQQQRMGLIGPERAHLDTSTGFFPFFST